jgi:hypothetical protein
MIKLILIFNDKIISPMEEEGMSRRREYTNVIPLTYHIHTLNSEGKGRKRYYASPPSSAVSRKAEEKKEKR